MKIYYCPTHRVWVPVTLMLAHLEQYGGHQLEAVDRDRMEEIIGRG